MATCHYIRARGKPEPFRDIYEEVRWLEFVYYPGQTIEERVEILKKTGQRYPYSIYKTHEAPPNIQLRDDARYIFAVRNAVDAMASLRPFFRGTLKSFSDWWGGFPPMAGSPDDVSDEEYEKFVLVS